MVPVNDDPRLQAIYDLGDRLRAAPTPEDLVTVALSTAAAALSLRSAVVAMRVAGDTRLVGWPEGPAAADALSHARAGFALMLQEPELAVRGAEVHRGGSEVERHFVLMPLAVGNGPLLGALQLESEIPLDESDLSVARSIIAQLVNVLDRWVTAERRACESERQRTLAELGAALGEARDVPGVVDAVCRTLVPALADVSFVDLLHDDECMERIGVTFADPLKQQQVAPSLAAVASRLGWETVPARAMATGKPVLMADAESIERSARDKEHLGVLRAAGITSVVVAPLLARGHVFGAVTLGLTRSDRGYGLSDLAIAAEIGQRIAFAIDNVRLFGEMQAAVAARDRLLAFVSHDLRGPLNVIGMCASALLSKRDAADWSDRCAAGLQKIRRAAERATALVEQLLDVSRARAGQLSLRMGEHEVATIVAEATSAVEPAAQQKNVTLLTELDPAAGRVRCDVDRILQVLGNLLGNAIKFTPAGGSVTLRVKSAPNEVTFAVADTGPGIPEDQLPYLFEAFWQGAPGSTSGAGLGLAIARGIVDAHGGKITVETVPGAGTTFCVALPRAP